MFCVQLFVFVLTMGLRLLLNTRLCMEEATVGCIPECIHGFASFSGVRMESSLPCQPVNAYTPTLHGLFHVVFVAQQ
ncbi:hypothetical protein VD0002_g772 [Verticillium dahliae]|uniref:Secreted protein n=1 Tax=Verticillium dahliae TaxID=27337 RepID=A0AA45ANR6_VERDA|nr:hypothetical protein BJF96_g3008 [Verticillium dahliae]PNH55742.1 hypothetical protein VD0003_g1895 [Verticillium dahliae]PNH69653.1 hypothetical protein VD0002_g772 [Verticillium dahliae]